MESVTVRIRKDRYERLADAVAALLASYGVARPPADDFDIETLRTVTEFERFEIMQDFAVRLGEARRADRDGEGDAIELEVHAHHLVAAVAAFPDLAGAADAPEPDLRVIVEGLCYAYLVALTGMPDRRETG